MMKTVKIHEAKARLSGLVKDVERRDQTVVLSRYGKPVARIVPYRPHKRTKIDSRLSRIRYTGDLTAPTEEEWENA
jgi:prevent-host-death family protein